MLAPLRLYLNKLFSKYVLDITIINVIGIFLNHSFIQIYHYIILSYNHKIDIPIEIIYLLYKGNIT